MKSAILTLVAVSVSVGGCSERNLDVKEQGGETEAADTVTLSKRDIAVIMSRLPVGAEQLDEVYSAVSGSSGNGYDEEYMLRDLFENPGAGVGSGKSKPSVSYGRPLKDLFVEYLQQSGGTKTTAAEIDAIVSSLTSSDLQIYWPYSEDWDGESLPIVTFDPGYGADTNYGYFTMPDGNGGSRLDSMVVDEAVARTTPVWVINTNDDSGYTPVILSSASGTQVAKSNSRKRILRLKSFRMLRQYDSWFGGASEFRVQMGSVDGFTASTEAELKLYQPSITEFYIVVKRKYVGKDYPFDGILMTDFTNQLDKLAFLVTEDDGGTRTTWKCSATVKVKSKSYGFELEFPLNEKDDIVWRGQLDASFLQTEDEVSGRFGDTVITFELD